MNKNYKDLCELFASIKNVKEANLLIQDLFTPQEIEVLMERWQLVQELAKGTAQRTVAKKLGVSISTVTRGSLALQHGKQGFLYFLKKLGKFISN